MKINSHNEWDKLREVVLGSADKQSAVLTWDRKDPVPLENLKKAQSLSKDAYPQWLLDEVNEDLDLYRYKSAMTHAAAPAYMTARWYYDYFIHWRSPHGKTPPAYEPSPEIVGLCPWLDERFPPTPRYMYIFSPVDVATHSWR